MPKLAVIQAAPMAFDMVATLERFSHLLADATAQGAELAVFPEAFIGGYPKGLDFGMRLGMRTDAGRDDFRRYYDGAIDVPGPDFDKLSALVGGARINVVVGVIERDGGTLYCTALIFAADGTLLGKHRKLMPTGLERGIWGQGDGSTLPVVDTDVGRVGAVICWENRMPLLRTAMYAKGVEIYCAPTVDDRDNWIPTVRHIAQEGRCFVLSACQFARRSDYPENYECIQGNDPEGVLIRGGSCIVGPFGDLLAGPIYDEESILVADIDLSDIARGKYDLDVVGHYARPDIFRLHVNEAPQPPVTFGDDFGGNDLAEDEASEEE